MFQTFQKILTYSFNHLIVSTRWSNIKVFKYANSSQFTYYTYVITFILVIIKTEPTIS